MYIRRHLERAIRAQSRFYGAVLVTGARQVGKTTLLCNAFKKAAYASFDDAVLLNAARQNPRVFVDSCAVPTFIDEIQYAPELFSSMKLKIDGAKKKPLFFLSGSQQFQLMKNASDSLAGRVAVYNLLSLSQRELNKETFSQPFVPNQAFFAQTRRTKKLCADALWQLIFRGTMPALCVNQNMSAKQFYANYTTTYIERDIRALERIADESKFLRFITVVASRTAQLLNMSDLARDTDVSVSTVERWLSLLQTSNLVTLVTPFYSNVSKRMLKAPKLYFLDTGLAAYLTGWDSPSSLERGIMSGAMFETFVVSEIFKSWYNSGDSHPPIYYYRDKDGREIDLLIAVGDKLHPIEIKKHATPKASDTRHFAVLDKQSQYARGEGVVISTYGQKIALDDKNFALPVNGI